MPSTPRRDSGESTRREDGNIRFIRTFPARYLFVRNSAQRKTFTVRCQIEISHRAREQLRALPREQRRQIGWRLEEMRDDLRGDVLKL